MRFFLLLLLSLILLQSVLAADVAYVHKYPENSNILSLLNLRYSYDLIKDSDIPSTDFSAYKFIIVQDAISNKDEIPVNKNIISFDKDMIKARWTDASISPPVGATQLRLKMCNKPSEPLVGTFTAGISNLNDMIISLVNVNYYSMTFTPSYVNKIACYSDNPILAYTYRNAVKTVFFGAYEADKWRDDAKILFNNSLTWVSQSDDNDNDRYCKAGVLIQNKTLQCPLELGSTGTDCNDQNSGINPGAIETAYDGVDENCNGYDLLDKDNDGYCKYDEILQNKSAQCNRETRNIGTDCNDDDNTVYPNATEILDGKDNNCVNDAPRKKSGISDLSNYIILEGDEKRNAYNLSNYFVDYDGDNLVFNIRGSSSLMSHFNIAINNGIVDILLKDYYGRETFYFTASDSFLTANSNNVSITSVRTNDCLEQDGFVCSGNQTCQGQRLNSSDATLCCAVECEEIPLAFNGISVCQSDNGINLTIAEPGQGDSFKVGENIIFKIEFKNNLNRSFDGNVKAYLYSINNDEVIADDSETLELSKGSMKTLSFNFETPYDVEEGEYAVYAQAKDTSCSDKYVKIEITKEDSNVAIKSIDAPEEARCGENANFKVSVLNKGNDISNVYVNLEISELKLSKKGNKFNLKSGKTAVEDFDLSIPDSAKNKNYTVKAVVYYGSTSSYETESFSLSGCVNSSVSINSSGRNINSTSSNAEADNGGFSIGIIIALVANGAFIIGIFAFVLFIVLRKNVKVKRKRRNKK